MGEARWYFPMLLACFMCIGRGASAIMNLVKGNGKAFVIAFVALLLLFGGFMQYQQTDMLVNAKLPSYNGIKQASLYVETQTVPGDLYAAVPSSQPAYYSEREVWHIEPNLTLENFVSECKKGDIKFVAVTFAEPWHPEWMIYTAQQGIWEIPFTNTTLDFNTGGEDIKGVALHDTVTFQLEGIFDETFLYRVYSLNEPNEPNEGY